MDALFAVSDWEIERGGGYSPYRLWIYLLLAWEESSRVCISTSQPVQHFTYMRTSTVQANLGNCLLLGLAEIKS